MFCESFKRHAPCWTCRGWTNTQTQSEKKWTRKVSQRARSLSLPHFVEFILFSVHSCVCVSVVCLWTLRPFWECEFDFNALYILLVSNRTYTIQIHFTLRPSPPKPALLQHVQRYLSLAGAATTIFVLECPPFTAQARRPTYNTGTISSRVF